MGRLGHAFKWCRWAVEDLSDADYFWEPTEECWGVRPRSTGVPGWGTGDWICEDTDPPPDPPLITSIGWRIVHMAGWTDIYRDWTFGERKLSLAELEVPGSAAEAVVWLTRSQDQFLQHVSELSDADLDRIGRAHYGADQPVGWLIWAVLVEHMHHGAEVALLRDLRRGHGRSQRPQDAV